MIASVVVTTNEDPHMQTQLRRAIAGRPEFDVGSAGAVLRRIPIVIDVGDRHAMEEATNWLRNQEGVQAVDVVFVHLEQPASTTS